jgi:ribonuclease BN (tRNA processing enzyme)
VLQRWDIGAGRIPELQVYGPPPLKRMTAQLFGPDGAYGPDIEARTQHQGSIDVFAARGGKPPRQRPDPQVTELAPGDVVTGPGGAWTVTTGRADHVQPNLDCLAYRIETPAGAVCYSGDSGGRSQAIIRLARDCDVLIHMVHYLSGTEPTEIYRRVCGNHLDTAHIAREAGVKTLVITHVLEQIDQPGVRERVLNEMAAIFPGTLIWGEDLMRIPLQGAEPAKLQ